jgi:hypothetical protein
MSSSSSAAAGTGAGAGAGAGAGSALAAGSVVSGWTLQASRSTGALYWHRSGVSWWHDAVLPVGWAWGQASASGPRFWVELATGRRCDAPPVAGGAGAGSAAAADSAASAGPPPSKRARLQEEASAPYRYLVYPDYVPELLLAPLRRRGAAWADAAAAAPGDGSAARPPSGWRAVEAAVLANEWDFVSKPSVLFKGAACEAGMPGTLHSLPWALAAAAGAPRPQLVNHMPNPRALSSKTALWLALRAWCGARPGGGAPEGAGVPTTFILRSSAAPSFAAFRAAAAQPAAMPAAHCARGMWIVKPEKLLGGQGIELASSPDEVAALLDAVAARGLRTAEGGAVAAGANWVVQKYIERPLTLGGRKFDVRVLALVTDAWDVYVFEHGFIKMCSVPYSLERESAAADAAAAGGASQFSAAFAKVAHITNHCYQATSAGYGALEPSNLLSFDQLQTALDLSLGAGAASVRGQLWPRWAEAILTMLAAARASGVAGARPPPAAAGARRRPRHWFEIVGVDFVVDEHLRSWLIEANTTPGLEGHCAYADAVYGRAVEEAYARAVDGHFPLPHGAAPPPLPAAAYDDSAVAALPWAASVARAPLPPWVTAPWGGWAGGGGGGDDAPPRVAAPRAHPAPSSHTSNCWQLVWSERAADLRAIPHQAAMAAEADNAAAVDELLRAEAAAAAAGCAPVSDADAAAIAARHGLAPLLHAVQRTGAVAEAELRAGGSAAAEDEAAAAAAATAAAAADSAPPPPSPFWRPVLRRYMHRDDDAWRYPLGAP